MEGKITKKETIADWSQKTKDYITECLKVKASTGKFLSINMVVNMAEKAGYKEVNQASLKHFIVANKGKLVNMGIGFGKERMTDIDGSKNKHSHLLNKINRRRNKK